MDNPELYKKTCDILVDAYFNDTLQHANCSACAVGNIVSKSIGAEISKGARFSWLNYKPRWQRVFVTQENFLEDGYTQTIREQGYCLDAKFQIDATGYTWRQLAKIEYAFETAPFGSGEDEYMFNGLMQVIEALDTIHGNTDTELTATTKSRFNKAPQL